MQRSIEKESAAQVPTVRRQRAQRPLSAFCAQSHRVRSIFLSAIAV